MPAATKELVEKNNALIKMNKAKAYRELQRRQGKLIHRVWSESSSISQSYDSPLQPNRTNRTEKQQKVNMVESDSIQDALFTKRYIGASMFTINKTGEDRQRPLSRATMTSKSKNLYTDFGRPVTAPETNAYATLDGPRQEVMVIPFYTKANSVRSDTSNTESLNGRSGKRYLANRKLRQSLDLTQSIDCNNNTPLKPHNQNEQIGQAIRYPTASKMRQMLTNDLNIPPEKPATTDQGSRSIMKRASQVTCSSKTSSIQHQPPVHTTETKVHRPTTYQSNTGIPIAKKVQQLNSAYSVPRKSIQNKQVSFDEGKENSAEKTTTSISTAGAEEQPLALTTKNLNMYNAMVLRTLRTSKFDERIVQWVKERQCDRRTGIPRHDIIPEVDESSYRESPMPSHGRLTPNKRDHRGSTTPTDNNKTLLGKASAPPLVHTEHRSLNVKPTALTVETTVNPGNSFSYSVDKANEIVDKAMTHEPLKKDNDIHSETSMSARTSSDPRQSKEITKS